MTIGSSFTVGSGVSDNDVLAAQLAADSGMSVYNAGGLAPAAVWIERLLQRLQMHHGILLVEIDRPARESACQPILERTSVDDPCDTSAYVQPKALYAMSNPSLCRISPADHHPTPRPLRENDVVLPNTQNASSHAA